MEETRYKLKEHHPIKKEHIYSGCSEEVWNLLVQAEQTRGIIPNPSLIIQLPHTFHYSENRYVVEVGGYGLRVLRGTICTELTQLDLGFQHFRVMFTENPFDIKNIEIGEIYEIYRKVSRNGDYHTDYLFIP